MSMGSVSGLDQEIRLNQESTGVHLLVGIYARTSVYGFRTTRSIPVRFDTITVTHRRGHHGVVLTNYTFGF
jgi:hypothetical protein